MIRSTPPRSANLAEIPVPAPAPMMGIASGDIISQAAECFFPGYEWHLLLPWCEDKIKQHGFRAESLLHKGRHLRMPNSYYLAGSLATLTPLRMLTTARSLPGQIHRR